MNNMNYVLFTLCIFKFKFGERHYKENSIIDGNQFGPHRQDSFEIVYSLTTDYIHSLFYFIFT